MPAAFVHAAPTSDPHEQYAARVRERTERVRPFRSRAGTESSAQSCAFLNKASNQANTMTCSRIIERGKGIQRKLCSQ